MRPISSDIKIIPKGFAVLKLRHTLSECCPGGLQDRFLPWEATKCSMERGERKETSFHKPGAKCGRAPPARTRQAFWRTDWQSEIILKEGRIGSAARSATNKAQASAEWTCWSKPGEGAPKQACAVATAQAARAWLHFDIILPSQAMPVWAGKVRIWLYNWLQATRTWGIRDTKGGLVIARRRSFSSAEWTGWIRLSGTGRSGKC